MDPRPDCRPRSRPIVHSISEPTHHVFVNVRRWHGRGNTAGIGDTQDRAVRRVAVAPRSGQAVPSASASRRDHPLQALGNVQSVSEISTAHPAPARMSLLFANCDFWRLWYAGPDRVRRPLAGNLAVAVFVYRATGSPFLVAMMTMLRLLPMGLFGAVLGAVAERLERRTALLGVITMMGCTSASLAMLAYGGRLAVWQLAAGQLHQRPRLGHRQPGAPRHDRRGGRQPADGRGDVDRRRHQQRQPHAGSDHRAASCSPPSASAAPSCSAWRCISWR